MKNKLAIASLVLITCTGAGVLQAASETTPPAAQPAKKSVTDELNPLIEKIKTKLQAGTPTEESLAAEFKEFDAILAAHKGEKTDEVAQVLLMKAMLYLEILENFDKGEVALKQLKADFPESSQAKQVDMILGMISKQKEMAKLQEALKPGLVFPDFDEKDTSGQPLSIAKYKGKVVLIDFWATWCGPCVAELPNVIAAYTKYHDKGFEIIGISLDQEQEKLTTFTKEKKMTWPQYFDGKGWENKLSQKYGIQSIPATFLLDKQGKIVAKDLRGDALDVELAKLLGK